MKGRIPGGNGKGRRRRASHRKFKESLGMRQRPTTAGQARFGDVDVSGGLLGAQLAPQVTESEAISRENRSPGPLGRGELEMALRHSR
jgi:hypothetical protein